MIFPPPNFADDPLSPGRAKAFVGFFPDLLDCTAIGRQTVEFMRSFARRVRVLAVEKIDVLKRPSGSDAPWQRAWSNYGLASYRQRIGLVRKGAVVRVSAEKNENRFLAVATFVHEMVHVRGDLLGDDELGSEESARLIEARFVMQLYESLGEAALSGFPPNYLRDGVATQSKEGDWMLNEDRLRDDVEVKYVDAPAPEAPQDRREDFGSPALTFRIDHLIHPSLRPWWNWL